VSRDVELESLVRRTAEMLLGARVAAVEAIPAQLGLRRFFRLRLTSGPAPTLIARVERPEDPAGRPEGVPPEPPLEPIRALLEANGLPVPKRYGADATRGIKLLEYLGDDTLRAAAVDASPAELRALYEQACDLVPRMQAIEPAPRIAAFERRLDDALFAYKADLFKTWALVKLDGDGSRGERACVDAAFAVAARAAAEAPQRLAHRDFQSANLHVVPGRGLVMIDLQGAFLAPPEYDLACLLGDSYVTIPEAECVHQLARVRPQLPDAPSPEEFARRFDLLTVTRKSKDLARFLYAAAERGEARFRAFIEPTFHTLRAAAERAARRDSELADFAELCDELREDLCAR